MAFHICLVDEKNFQQIFGQHGFIKYKLQFRNLKTEPSTRYSVSSRSHLQLSLFLGRKVLFCGFKQYVHRIIVLLPVVLKRSPYSMTGKNYFGILCLSYDRFIEIFPCFFNPYTFIYVCFHWYSCPMNSILFHDCGKNFTHMWYDMNMLMSINMSG